VRPVKMKKRARDVIRTTKKKRRGGNKGGGGFKHRLRGHEAQRQIQPAKTQGTGLPGGQSKAQGESERTACGNGAMREKG